MECLYMLGNRGCDRSAYAKGNGLLALGITVLYAGGYESCALNLQRLPLGESIGREDSETCITNGPRIRRALVSVLVPAV